MRFEFLQQADDYDYLLYRSYASIYPDGEKKRTAAKPVKSVKPRRQSAFERRLLGLEPRNDDNAFSREKTFKKLLKLAMSTGLLIFMYTHRDYIWYLIQLGMYVKKPQKVICYWKPWTWFGN